MIFSVRTDYGGRIVAPCCDEALVGDRLSTYGLPYERCDQPLHHDGPHMCSHADGRRSSWTEGGWLEEMERLNARFK